MSAYDPLAYVDKSIDNVESLDITWRNDEVLAMLRDLRAQLTADPDWSEVQEANLRAELARVREDAIHAQLATDVARAIYDMTIAGLRRQLESARRIAVAFEQDLALSEVSVGRRAL